MSTSLHLSLDDQRRALHHRRQQRHNRQLYRYRPDHGTTYYYVVTALNAGGVGYASAQTTGVPGTQSPQTDTPVLPPWGLALMAVLLFLVSTLRLLRHPEAIQPT